VGVWGLSGLLCVGGLSCCLFRLWLFSGAVTRGCSTLHHCCCLPLGSQPGLGLSLCAPARVLCASVSPRVDMSVRVCSLVWFPIKPVMLPTGRLCFAACTNGGRPSFSSWVRTSRPASVSARRMVVCVPRFLSVGFLSDKLVPSHCHIACLSGLPTVALWVSWPVLLRFCVGRSSSPPPCVSHPLLSDLHH
jgi:hypothetical protein